MKMKMWKTVVGVFIKLFSLYYILSIIKNMHIFSFSKMKCYQSDLTRNSKVAKKK